MKQTYHGIYVDIDCILDTRLGTLAKMDEDLPLKVIEAGYHTRKSDFFKEVDLDRYHDLYRSRDIDTLYCSYATSITDLLVDLIKKIDTLSIMEQSNTAGKIYINVYPYDPTSGVIEAIKQYIAVRVGTTAEVDIINREPSSLSVEYCNSLFSVLFMYDYREWLYPNITEPKMDCNMQDKTIYTPAIYLEKEPTDEEIKEAKINSFKCMQMTLSPFIQFEFIDASIFSIKDITKFKP